MIVAADGFKDEEYFIPRQIIEKADFKVFVASNQPGLAQGTAGSEIQVNFPINQLKITEYQAIVFVGGPGCLKNLDNQDSYQLAQEAIRQNKILAAICISPVILAKAGVLKDKKATVWSSPLDKTPVQILDQEGAFYQAESVVNDGKIITANGPTAAQNFGQKIVEILKKQN